MDEPIRFAAADASATARLDVFQGSPDDLPSRSSDLAAVNSHRGDAGNIAI